MSFMLRSGFMPSLFRRGPAALLVLLMAALSACGGGGGGDGAGEGAVATATTVVNSLEDTASPPAGTVTLRFALASAADGQAVTFDPSLDGGTITLTLVGSEHSILKGEVFNPDQSYAGYQERDYGRSALYARKNVVIDASSLPGGISISWGGGDSNRARVLAVYGNLTLRNITITNGYSSAVAIDGGTQPYTLARGGAVAVWGTATLERCTLGGNRVSGDLNGSRDRGAFGGGIYGDRLMLSDCVVSGNTAEGYGAAGGGVYSVGGNEAAGASSLTRCSVSGNRVTAQHAYGGGVFTEGGGRGGSKMIALANCTISRNLAEDHPGLDQAPSGYYYRGGGLYMSNGWFALMNCTIAENAVSGHPAIFGGKPNMGGGGVAATIGDAHVVERMRVGHSIIAGNTITEIGPALTRANDLYSGSLVYFDSLGYNRVGVIDFSQILVPVPPLQWWSLSRKHWPKAGDQDGLALSDLVRLDSVEFHSSIVSRGVNEGQKAVLWYPPAANVVDQAPAGSYTVSWTLAQYSRTSGTDGDFLLNLLEKVRTDYGLGAIFGQDLVYSVHDFIPEPVTWARLTENVGWIKFWRDLDTELGSTIGAAKLEDAFWESIGPGPFGNVDIQINTVNTQVNLLGDDQRGMSRPAGGSADIGAIESGA